MNAEKKLTKFGLGASLILLAVLGIYIANQTYQYAIFVNGVMGIVVLYLLFFYIRHSSIDDLLETMLADAKIYKHLIYAFIGPGIAYWAMGGIFDMVTFLIKAWSNH